MPRPSTLLAAALIAPLVLAACEGKEATPAAPVKQPAAKPEAAPAKPAESKPTATQPTETKPTETKPAETKPADVKPAEPKAAAAPAEAKADAKTVKGPDGKDYAILSTTKSPGGVIVEEIQTGSGKEAKLDSTLVVHYEGKLANGTIFDSSYKKGQPQLFSLLRLVKGWQEAIPGMKVGGVRRLTIPPALGWPQGTPDGAVPANSTTYFWIQLVDVK